jgi:hypothetical protein
MIMDCRSRELERAAWNYQGEVKVGRVALSHVSAPGSAAAGWQADRGTGAAVVGTTRLAAAAPGRDRRRAEGAGPGRELPFADQIIAILVVLRFWLPHTRSVTTHKCVAN